MQGSKGKGKGKAASKGSITLSEEAVADFASRQGELLVPYGLVTKANMAHSLRAKNVRRRSLLL